MKKLVVFLLLGFASFALIAGNSSYAADDLVDLYPYDQQACLEGTNECANTKLGSSHWTMEFAGHRYHFVRGGVRYAKDFNDDDSNGLITMDELGGLSWNAFAGLIINDTDSEVILGTSNARTDLTSVVHRKYSYFDETGQLAMFEDHISTYYIFNDGTVEAPDWRLATTAEAAAWDAAEADDIDDNTPVTTRKTHIRMALDDVDTDGYVIEPLGYLTWTNADVDTATAPVEDWSTIINGDLIFDGNPNSVVIPAGWNVVSWGTLDRGTANPATTQYIVDMPGFMLDDTLDPAEMIYTSQPATFAGISGLDVDSVEAGVNMVVEFNGNLVLDPADVSASWINMFDETGKVINEVEKIDYSVTISQDGTDLETIDFTYDAVGDTYSASAEVTVIDSSVFRGTYDITWTAVTPEDDSASVMADIVVGVLPPRFFGVEDQFINQNVPIDVLDGITADDGYGNDKTATIEVTYPESFNPYNPFPGVYTVDLEFTHHVFIEGNSTFTLDGVETRFDGSLNEVVADIANAQVVYTDEAQVQALAFGWTASGVLIEVGGDGNVIRTINRHNWDLVDELGTNNPSTAQGMFDAWLSGLTFEEDGFLLLIGWKTDEYAAAQALAFGDPVSYDLEGIDLNEDIVTEASFTITVDDMTAPIAMVVNENYSIYAGQFASINNAILANVVAYDFTDAQDDLAIYVSNNGGLSVTTPGTYTVEVTVEDLVGHTDVVTFDVVVMAALVSQTDIDDAIDAADVLTEADIQALIDASVLTEADVEALIEAGVLSETAIQALIDASINDIPETGCGSAINGTSAIFITFSLVLGASAIFFFRRRR